MRAATICVGVVSSALKLSLATWNVTTACDEGWVGELHAANDITRRRTLLGGCASDPKDNATSGALSTECAVAVVILTADKSRINTYASSKRASSPPHSLDH